MTQPLRLVQFTDCHLFGDPAGLLRGMATLPSLRAAVADAFRTQATWDATLLTGDLVQDDPAGYAHIREVFGRFEHPVYCLPGNHDDLGAMHRELNVAPFSLAGHVRLGEWLIVMLDSCVPGDGEGTLSVAELGRLDNLLSERASPHALVCLHHQPVPMGSRWLDRVGLTNPADLYAVLDAHRAVRGLAWGHVHQAYDGARNGVKLMGTPATCAQFKPGVDGFAIDRRPPAFRWLSLHANGRIESAVEWAATAPPGQRLQSG